MNTGVLSLIALAIAVTVSCFTQLNVGLLAIALAWIVGVYFGGMSPREVASGFPVELFITLTGVTLLFSQARVNGTLEWVAHKGVGLCRGRIGLVPVLYFLLAGILASAGPGNIATIGLLGPIAMANASRMNISPFLMAIMVGNGAQAGSLSQFAPTGIIVKDLMNKIGLPGLETQSWLYNFFAHALVALGGFVIFGGWRLFLRAEQAPAEAEAAKRVSRNHILTLVVIVALIVGVSVFKLNIGMAAFAGFVLLSLFRVADQDSAIKAAPWGSILMVCGVTVLVSLLERTSGMDIFTGFVARVATEDTILPLVAIVIGVISAYSSTSAVVLPAFLPTVPGLVMQLGLTDAAALAMTMNVASHLVDVSPLSTIGALCVASMPAGPESRRLFNQLLAWGLSMSIVGAILTWLLFG
jgi:di/tricarboxylate transporter